MYTPLINHKSTLCKDLFTSGGRLSGRRRSGRRLSGRRLSGRRRSGRWRSGRWLSSRRRSGQASTAQPTMPPGRVGKGAPCPPAAAGGRCVAGRGTSIAARRPPAGAGGAWRERGAAGAIIRRALRYSLSVRYGTRSGKSGGGATSPPQTLRTCPQNTITDVILQM